MLIYEPLNKKWQKELTTLFKDLTTAGDYLFFHPHPLTACEAKTRIQYEGKDLYFLQFNDSSLCGYGFLRGWDEGYEIPSLGLAIHPKFRGQGFGEDLISFLHKQARLQNAKKVRLTVDRTNITALTLYRRLGYRFQDKDQDNLLGFIEL